MRRVGNSNVITIPRELEDLGYVDGATVMVEALPSGDLRIVPEARLRLAINRAVSRNRRALDLLAEYDRAGK